MNPINRHSWPRLISLCALSLCSLRLCGPLAAAETKKVTYADHVLPILRDKCFGCHDPDKVKGGLNVANYTTLMQGGSSGAVIKPGDPEGSRLYQLVTHKQKPTMPPKSDMLPKENLDTIRERSPGGALENAGSKGLVNKPKTHSAPTSNVKRKPRGPPPLPDTHQQHE